MAETMRVGILTVSDLGSRGQREDTAGPAIASIMEAHGGSVAARAMLPDERDQIAAQLKRWSDEDRLDVVFTTGGTGLAPRDVTPDATLDVIERVAPGFAEVMRAVGRQSTPLADLSRAVAGTRGATLIINLPGSERGARESLEAVLELLPHAVGLLPRSDDAHQTASQRQ
jgi:molybdenum cofactor synthesis domain-containing protein